MSEPSPWLDEHGRPTIPQDGLLPEPDPDALFPWLEPVVPVPAPVETLSPDRRRTLRQHALIQQGKHPLTGGPVGDAAKHGATCGNCAHRTVHFWTKRYPKCELHNTRSAATDCRAFWPACPSWKERDA